MLYLQLALGASRLADGKPTLCMTRLASLICSIFLALSARGYSQDGAPPELVVDIQKNGKTWRALHGINKGPLAAGGIIDLTEEQRALRLPWIRLHDCHWPNPDVVDHHAVFPNATADPSDVRNYDFRLTDLYLTAAQKTGAEIIYRLGESIEHTPVKRFVHPPRDAAHWAEVCLGIIRHYNEGWGEGLHLGIQYWEIWNEPENRPVMWTGSDAEFFHLYVTATKAIKKAFPKLKVGGPGIGATGVFEGGEFRPSAFLLSFLEYCRVSEVPLDFFSWHCYTDRPEELVMRAVAIRKLLDAHGFTSCESHLTEWNYLPGNSWEPFTKTASPLVRQRGSRAMAGAGGAAFIVSSLIALQDAPVDVAALFHGELGAFGLFDEYGVPTPNYYGVLASSRLLQTPLLLQTRSPVPETLTVAAGANAEGTKVTVIVSNHASQESRLRLKLKSLPWSGATAIQVSKIDDAPAPSPSVMTTLKADTDWLDIDVPVPGVTLIELTPSAPSP